MNKEYEAKMRELLDGEPKSDEEVFQLMIDHIKLIAEYQI